MSRSEEVRLLRYANFSLAALGTGIMAYYGLGASDYVILPALVVGVVSGLLLLALVQ